MDSNDIRVNVRAIEDFRDGLAPRLRQVAAAVSTLARTDGPELGHFHHARKAEQRYDGLHTEFLARARRLLTALVVAQAGTRSIATAYGSDRELFEARLQAVTEALVRSDSVQRDAVLRAAGLDPTVFREAARYEAMLAPPRRAPAGETTVGDSGQASA